MILLKVILTSLLVYFFSVFKAPLGTIIKVESLFKSFYVRWGWKGLQNTLGSLDKFLLPKENGGLGVPS